MGEKQQSAPKPTPEQEAIIAASRGASSLSINAYAGTGKTSTLQMLAPGASVAPALALAFNKSIATELQKRFPANYKVQTLNSLGYTALRRMLPSTTIDDRKLSKLTRAKGLVAEEADEVRELVALAMARGIVPESFGVKGLAEDSLESWSALGDVEPTIAGIELARELLLASIREAFKGTVSFDDQIYIPLFFGGRFPRFSLVLIDEAQDLSPLNHLQLSRVSSDRLIAVGDVRQAIYAWRGADAESMKSMRGLKSNWLELPLTTTWRCPKVIVRRSQEHAPGFNAPASAPEGRVLAFRNGTWTWALVREQLSAITGAPTLAVLCRNNAPLITLALRLLAQHIPAKVAGSDIGAQLAKLSRKLAPENATSQRELLRKIAEWKETQVSASIANDDGRADSITDRADSLLAIAGTVRDAGELRMVLARLFDDSNARSAVHLSSVHKAKGREWDCVLHLDPWRCPSPWAKSASAIEQEKNLRYVCETRTKHTLICANLEDFR